MLCIGIYVHVLKLYTHLENYQKLFVSNHTHSLYMEWVWSASETTTTSHHASGTHMQAYSYIVHSIYIACHRITCTCTSRTPTANHPPCIMYMYMYVVYSPAGIVQRSPSFIVLYVYVINSLNETLDDIKVAAPGMRNQYSLHSVHISKLLM